MNIYIGRNSKSYGPYTLEQFEEHLNKGYVAPSDYVWVNSKWYQISMLLVKALEYSNHFHRATTLPEIISHFISEPQRDE